MLSSMKEKHQDAYKTLFLEQKQQQAMQSEIAKEHAELRERGVFLERLQGCLSEGPTEAKLQVRSEELFHRETSVMKAREELTALRRESASRESSFVAQEELVHRKVGAIDKALTQVTSAGSLLESKSHQLDQQEALAKQSEAELVIRLEQLNAREAALSQRELSLVNNIHDMRVQQAGLAETRDKHREMSFMQLADSCTASKSCDACKANAACAWCAASADGKQGSCLAHNVNSVNDGLTSGQCTVKNWYSKVADRVTVLNLNIHGSDYSEKEQRGAAFFNTIISAGYPDFIALQDVTEWFLTLLKDQGWFKTYYHITEYPTKDGLDPSPGGLAIMSRFEIKRTSYAQRYEPSFNAIDQFPRVLLADFELADKAFTVATTSLDWRKAASRADALQFVAGVTSTIDNLIMLGDFGFDDGAEPETSKLPTSWLDVWLKLHNATGNAAPPSGPGVRGPNKFGFTWDPVSNLYARTVNSDARAARIDRVFVRSTSFLPREINMVGCPAPDYLCQDPPGSNSADNLLPYHFDPTDPLKEPVTFASPRYGLLVSLSLFAQHC